ncbi:MAG: tubulin-like doman-containing protein [Defluviitaleaceae bacterium]|nr:tubulin-like doman-containing protein [Defluviitaleaceae bacterium]MCL2240669.1 tubulin-like doman-containing protein [Defluviitaleaceae bacterium]
MKLSPETIADLRALDFEYGGGITTLSTKSEVIDKPILVVGLGGTGVESLIRVKKAINRHFRLPAPVAGQRPPDKPAQIEYLGIDSDETLLNLKYMDISFNEDEFVLLENANLTSIYKNRETVFKYSTHDWIADNLRLQQVRHGAGGIRQAGRFLLAINTNRVLGVLADKINRLIANRNANDLLYVFVLVGCAGGTGSGVFIDIPYMIRQLAVQKGFETENIGMIFLPDVTLSDSMIDGSAALNIKANGFAALKELDYLMSIEQTGEFFEHTYAELEIKTNRPPYDLCHLVSAKDEMGKLIPQAKNYCMNVAAETVINFIASEEVVDGQSYTINSYLSNIENNKAAFLTTHQQKQPVNYIYNIVGAASAQLPVEFLINFLTANMFAELVPMMEKSPGAESAQLALEAMKIDLPSLERALADGKPRIRDFRQYDKTVLGQRPDIIEEAVKKELSRIKEHYDFRAAQIAESFISALGEKSHILTQYFTDFELGPYYTTRLLDDMQDNSIPRLIDRLRKRDIQAKREHRDSVAALEIKRQAAIDRFNQRGLFSGFTKNQQAANLVKSNEAYLRAMDKNAGYDAIERVYETVQAALLDYREQQISTYCELLTTLRELFEKFRTLRHADVTRSETFTRNLAEPQEFCEFFEAEADPTLAIDYKAALKRLLTEMLKDNTWQPGTDHKIVENLNKFVTAQFQGVMYKSLDYYLVMMAKHKNIPAESYIHEKIFALAEAAKVMFPMNHVPSGLHITFPPYTYLSVPANAPQVRATAQSVSGRISSIKYSRMVNRLYMLNLKIAVALYGYKELNEYEAVYEASLNKIPGLHLYESEHKNWRNLPSPNYDKLWTADYENNRERARNDRIRSVFDRAVEKNLIKLDEKSHRYVCFYGDPVDIAARYAAVERGIAEKTISAPQARAIMQDLKQFSTSPDRSKYRQPLFDTEFLPDTDTPDMDYAKGVFIYMPALNERIAHEVELQERVEQLLYQLTKIDMAEVKYHHFAQALYMGVIVKQRKNFKFTYDEVEYILYTMERVSDPFVEYDVFQAYLTLDDALAAHLQKRAQDAENRLGDDEYDPIIKTLSDYIDIYRDKLTHLDQVYQDERGGAQKRLFYRSMLDVFMKEKAVLS